MSHEPTTTTQPDIAETVTETVTETILAAQRQILMLEATRPVSAAAPVAAAPRRSRLRAALLGATAAAALGLGLLAAAAHGAPAMPEAAHALETDQQRTYERVRLSLDTVESSTIDLALARTETAAEAEPVGAPEQPRRSRGSRSRRSEPTPAPAETPASTQPSLGGRSLAGGILETQAPRGTGSSKNEFGELESVDVLGSSGEPLRQ